MVYYNEFDRYAAAWLRELIRAGELPDGEVDERSIEEVRPNDLAGFTACHFFAGIGGWPLALRWAGWPDDRPVWTGSCPCQPFSSAGKGLGTADHRHLWPVWARLVAECRPPAVFGEQVASSAGRDWLAGVRGDLEAMGYAVGAADLCAAGVGAPHIRQRLFWVADHQHAKRRTLHVAGQNGRDWSESRREEAHGELGARREIRAVAYANGGDAGTEGLQRSGQHGQRTEDGGAGGVEHPESDGREQRRAESSRWRALGGRGESPWCGAQWLACTDGKARRIEPGTFPLAHGIPGRVGLLRGYGNAIVPQVAAEFVAAFLETEN